MHAHNMYIMHNFAHACIYTYTHNARDNTHTVHITHHAQTHTLIKDTQIIMHIHITRIIHMHTYTYIYTYAHREAGTGTGTDTVSQMPTHNQWPTGLTVNVN